ARGLANAVPRALWPIFLWNGQITQSQWIVLASIEPVLSLALILYTLGTARVGTPTTTGVDEVPAEVPTEPRHLDWKRFFFPAGVSLALLVLAAIFTFAFNQDSNAKDTEAAVGGVVFAVSMVGVGIQLPAVLVLALKRRRASALGCLLSALLLCFIGFFGCVAL